MNDSSGDKIDMTMTEDEKKLIELVRSLDYGTVSIQIRNGVLVRATTEKSIIFN